MIFTCMSMQASGSDGAGITFRSIEINILCSSLPRGPDSPVNPVPPVKPRRPGGPVAPVSPGGPRGPITTTNIPHNVTTSTRVGSYRALFGQRFYFHFGQK